MFQPLPAITDKDSLISESKTLPELGISHIIDVYGQQIIFVDKCSQI